MGLATGIEGRASLRRGPGACLGIGRHTLGCEHTSECIGTAATWTRSPNYKEGAMDSDKISYDDFKKAVAWLEENGQKSANYTLVMSPELIAALDEYDDGADAIYYNTHSIWKANYVYVDKGQMEALSPKRDLDKFDYLLEEAK